MGFETNGDEFQTPLKASYTVPRERWVDAAAAVSEVAPVQIVTSGEQDFDIIPIGAGKAAPLPYLTEMLAVAPERVVAAGDSMNDLTMLMAVTKRIVVGNADQALIDAIGGRAFLSRGHFAAGVKEGIRALGVIR
jgi:hydroxymethylpyrimidine pyrophosphatase-like HAD family hydrolase